MSAITTVGIDLASGNRDTAACQIEWTEYGARVVGILPQADDAALIALASSADKVGIDVPLGWPRKFVEAVWSHSEGSGWPTDYEHRAHRDDMRFRMTDIVAREYGQRPLSVSSDLIAVPAMRAAWLLPHLEGRAVDLSGAGKVVEVYPALALRCWSLLPSMSYKGPTNIAVRQRVFDQVEAVASWLDVGPYEKEIVKSDHVLDAMVAAIVARAHRCGYCVPIPSDNADAAAQEGWIAIPVADALRRLGGANRG